MTVPRRATADERSSPALGLMLALSVLAGPDPHDATAAYEPVPEYTAALTGDIRGMRLGVPRTMLDQGVDADVRTCFDDALDVLRSRGA